MHQIQRFAIYYAPRPGRFADVAAAWLGWDPGTGRDVRQPDIPGLPCPLADLTGAPRRYGFHGTIKAPFRLADGADPADLKAATASLAARLGPVEMPGLRLSRIGGFLALTPDGDTGPLGALAATAVTDLDLFRAAPSEADIARRAPARLTPRQRELLVRWGYPYVMEEFQFHLTLTDNLSPDLAAATASVLAPHMASVTPSPFVVQDLCLFGEDDRGRFHLLHRYALSG
jgi:putative phosphonate metabolism protein